MLKIKKLAGFTLIELVMTIAIMSILSVIVGRLLLASFNGFTNSNAINITSTEAVMGVERMVYDLRNASSLTAIASNALTFVDQSGTSYAYALSGKLLQRGSYTLIDNVNSIAFTYLDASGAVTAVLQNVQYVKITLSMLDNNIPISYTTLVYLRGVY